MATSMKSPLFCFENLTSRGSGEDPSLGDPKYSGMRSRGTPQGHWEHLPEGTTRNPKYSARAIESILIIVCPECNACRIPYWQVVRPHCWATPYRSPL